MENTALILIDIQNDYFPGGALVLDGAEHAAKQAAKILNVFREKQQPVVHILHEALKPEIGFMLPGSVGQEIHNSVEPRENESSMTKHYPNAFWKTELETYLSELGIKNLVIVGMMTHMCVSATTRAAMEREFHITVIQDACATGSLELNGEDIPSETVHKTALAELTSMSKISSLEEYIAE